MQEFKINILVHWLIWKEIIDIMINIFWKESLKTVMINNSTNINKTNNDLSPQSIEHNKIIHLMNISGDFIAS